MNKQQFIKTIGFCAISLAITSVAAAPKVESSFNAEVLVSPQLALPSVNNNRQLVQFSQTISEQFEMLQKGIPVKAVSQEYRFSVNGSQLKKGISIDVSGLGSLISFSPKSSLASKGNPSINSNNMSKNIAIDLDLVEITLPNGASFKGESAMSFKADSKQLSNTGFAKGTSAFKLDKSLNSKKFQLKTSQVLADEQEYWVNVLEKNSPFKLKMELQKQQIIAGDRLSAKVNMDAQGKRVSLGQTEAQFVSPSGQIFPAKLTSDKNGGLMFDKAISLPFATTAGLWELQVSTQGKQGEQVIKRNSKLAFSYQPKTAQIGMEQSTNGLGDLKTNNNGLSYLVNVSASHAGRYEVTGMLYLVNETGSRKAVALARSAKWIEPGSDSVPLLFKSSILPKLQNGQHFEVAQLGLNDQSRMSVLQ